MTNPIRLSIVAALAGVEQAEFALIRDAVEITDAALSKHVALLEQAGYLGVDKGRVGRRPRTWRRLTGDRCISAVKCSNVTDRHSDPSDRGSA